MSRQIIDSSIQESLRNLDSEVYSKILKEFQGTVKDTQDKTTVKTSEFGFSKISLKEIFLKTMQTVEPDGDECIIELQGNKIEVPKKEFTILKMLAIEQISKSDEYSEVLSRIFLQFMPQVLMRKNQYSFEADNNYDSLKLSFYNFVVDFILEQLNIKAIKEVEEDTNEDL